MNFGKVLFVDDRFDETVREAVTTLIKKGMAVQYWDGRGDFPDTIHNVRVVVLDLDLVGLGTRTPGPEYYSEAVKALHKIPGPFIVVIMAIDFNEDDPSGLRSHYEETYESPMCGYVAQDGITKRAELADPSRLADIIASSIEESYNLILLWEVLMDRAKDMGLGDLFAGEIENTIRALIKFLCKDFGQESATRELISLMIRLVSRRTKEGKEFDLLKQLIAKLNAVQLKQGKYPGKEDLQPIFNRLMFFEPAPQEEVWTGDIYKTNGSQGSKYDKYAIVLTPRCDLAQNKAARILACFAFPLCEKYFEDPEYPPRKFDPAVVRRQERGTPDASILKYMKERYMQGKSDLPKHFHVIWNFHHDGDFFGLCFDFHNVQSFDVDRLKLWKRICRLDSPFIDETLEKYGKLVARIGTPSINRSPIQLRTFLQESES